MCGCIGVVDSFSCYPCCCGWTGVFGALSLDVFCVEVYVFVCVVDSISCYLLFLLWFKYLNYSYAKTK